MIRQQLSGKRPSFKVVAMPDFYLDYLITYPGRLEDLTADLSKVAERGGGNVVGWTHKVGRGGNAANLIAQLAKLGVDVSLLVETDELGLSLMEKSLPNVDLSHVTVTGTLSSTVSIEAEHSGRHVNIMASNPGSRSGFGPEKLTEDAEDLIARVNFVCVTNWAKNNKGTELAEHVFKLAHEAEAVTFFDPADPTSRAGEIPGLNEKVLSSGLVDILSVNENELQKLASVVREESPADENPLFEAASVFSMLGARVDLHTPEFSATFLDGQRIRVPCLKLKPIKVTGAGDIWNGADIYAQGMGLDHKERLIFSNAAAAAYLKRSGFEPPTLDEILNEADELERLSGRSKL